MKELFKHTALLPVLLLVIYLSVFPELELRFSEKGAAHPSVAFHDFDEVSYLSYAKSIKDGFPRKNNPYLPDRKVSNESLFSVQMIPPYVIAYSANLFGTEIDTSFIIVCMLCALFAVIIVYALLFSLIGDRTVSGLGALAFFSFGPVISGLGVLRQIVGVSGSSTFFPFLRRYNPGFGFPFLFLFFFTIWKTLSAEKPKTRNLFALASVAIFNLLLYSYFYLWSGALGWLLLIFLLFLIFRRKKMEKGDLLRLFSVIAACTLSLVPYFFLIGNMNIDNDLIVLERTRTPIIFSHFIAPGMIGIIFAAVIWVFKRNVITKPRFLVAISFLLLPFVVLNQQVITGISLQPFHYARFVSNFTVILGVVILFYELLADQADRTWWKILAIILGLFSIGWAIAEQISNKSTHDYNTYTFNRSMPVNRYLQELDANDTKSRSATLNLDIYQGELQNVYARNPILWNWHMTGFGGISFEENRLRLLKYLYFSDVEPETFNGRVRNCLDQTLCTWLFGGKNIRTHSIKGGILEDQEIESVIGQYKDLYLSFDKQKASQPMIGSVIVVRGEKLELNNLQRWYEILDKKQFPDHILYEVKIKE